MFSKFSSIFHQAVEAFVPTLSQLHEFQYHWKAVTQYFVDTKDHKISIDQTALPSHLNQMVQILLSEEKCGQVGLTGPCMEYVLQHRILETLYTLARTDCPPGMKQVILQLFSRLLSRISQPLLPHINVHRPVQRLVRICGEVRAGPTEIEEVQFLLILCSKIKSDPYIVNFFIETPKAKSNTNVDKSTSSETIEIRRRHNRFTIVDSLLNLVHSEDARVGVKACEGLILISSLPEHNSARHLVDDTNFLKEMTSQLCALYMNLSKVMDPSDVESVDAKWGLDLMTTCDDHKTFLGKRQLTSFLSWMDFCDQLISVAHHDIACALSSHIRTKFLEEIVEPALLQTSEAVAITTTAILCKCLRLVSSQQLLKEFVLFILGEDVCPEKEGSSSGPRLRRRLIERCDHISEEMCLITWKLFEVLLTKPDEHVLHNLVLRNLLGRQRYTTSELPGCSGRSAIEGRTLSRECSLDCTNHADDERLSISNTPHVTADVTADETADVTADETADVTADETADVTADETADVTADETADVTTDEAAYITANETADLNCSSIDDDEITDRADDEIRKSNSETSSHEDCVQLTLSHEVADVNKTLDSDSRLHSGNTPLHVVNNSDEDLNTNNSAASRSNSTTVDENRHGIHQVINFFLNLLPEEAKSSNDVSDSGYDVYLRDAHLQFAALSPWCEELSWPVLPICNDCNRDGGEKFYEGSFLKILFDKLSDMLQQSYDINLQVTCVASQLALFPHPNLQEYLCDPHLVLIPGCRNLPSILIKLSTDVTSRMRSIPDFHKRLVAIRHKLIGCSDNLRRRSSNRVTYRCVEDSTFLAGSIVLEEFCKELAASAFVKHHARILKCVN